MYPLIFKNKTCIFYSFVICHEFELQNGNTRECLA